MPFTPPTTYASQANSGYEAQFSYGSPLVAMVEVKSINFPRFTVPKLNRTHLLSPQATEEYTPGLLDPGTLALTGNYIGDVSQAADLDAQALNLAVFAWQYTAPVKNRSQTLLVVGTGFFTKFDMGPFEPNRPVEFSCDIQTAGFSTVTIT